MPVLCEMYCIDVPDPQEEAIKVLKIATPRIGEVREIELRGTRVIYEVVNDRSIKVLHIILGGVEVVLSDPEELFIEEDNRISHALGRVWNSDPEIGTSAIMLGDGNITYLQDPPEPGTTIMVRSQHLIPNKGEIIFG